MKKIYALVDCNNFFVSCERVFNPSLKGVPVLVLSNNDGCVVARSQEVKDIGIKMGEPLFKIKHIVDEYNIRVLSSNFSLYADMSNRVMNMLSRFAYNTQVYSVDEAYLDLTDYIDKDLSLYCQNIRFTVLKSIGIPVSIGIGLSKTQAKLANHIAKKEKTGVFSFVDKSLDEIKDIYSKHSVEEVWGIGRSSLRSLNIYGIYTVLDYINASEVFIKSKLTVRGLQTQLELKGQDVITDSGDHRKSISMGRTFAKSIYNKETISSYITSFISSISSQLRSEGLYANSLNIFLATNYHREEQIPGFPTKSVLLPQYTNESILIVKSALKVLDEIYIDGLGYKKCIVTLSEICDDSQLQTTMFIQKDMANIYSSIDKINRRWKGSIFLAREVRKNEFTDVRESVSPRYTTSWSDIPNVVGY